jgi:hypothetical protein
MAKATKRKAPSRVRYEHGHPTVSCRVPREVYNRLQKVKEAEGQSFADILKIGLGILEVRVKEEAKVRKQGYAKGHTKGYAEAESLYKVTYFCSVCRGLITVTTRGEKEAIRQYMQEHRWDHGACIKKKG